MNADPRGTVFEPSYRWLVRLGVAIPVLFGAFVAGSSLVLHGSLLGAAIALGLFAAPPLLLSAAMLWYRRIEFRRDGLYLERPLFPDRTVRYDEFSQLGSGGAKAGSHLVVWTMMRNGAELRRRFEQLADLDLTRDLEFSDEALERRKVRGKVIPICVGIVTGVAAGMSAAGVSLTSSLIAATAAAVVSYRLLMRALEPDADEER